MQERHDSIANALEIRLSCTNPSICRLEGIQYYVERGKVGRWVCQMYTCKQWDKLMDHTHTWKNSHKITPDKVGSTRDFSDGRSPILYLATLAIATPSLVFTWASEESEWSWKHQGHSKFAVTKLSKAITLCMLNELFSTKVWKIKEKIFKDKGKPILYFMT